MRFFAAIALAAFASPALGKSPTSGSSLPSPDEISGRDTLTIGVGAAILPDYEGSDDYRIVPAGAVRGRYHGISFDTSGTYLYVDLIPMTGKVTFEAGPVAGARLETRKHVDDADVKLLPHLNTAVEVGAFAGIGLHGLTNPYDTLSLRVDAAHDVANAHKSTVVGATLSFSTPLSRKTYVSASAGAEFVSHKFADYYYSITPEQSLATGGALPVFNASGGLKNWKASLLANQSITGDLLGGLSIFGLGQYSRLVGDFKRSPVVSQRGSANQWLGAIGLAYTW
jgi:outer membrane scaffolding protein for murein synthesis (MipA/OmpV family)